MPDQWSTLQAPTRGPGGFPDSPPPQPVSWGLLLIPALAQLVLHIVTAGRSGIFRDEYYYLACAARPAWGYVDQPPLSIWVLSVWKAVFGDSVHSIRVLPALCGSALVVMTGALAAQLGGARWAQFFAGLAAAIGAAALVIGGFYSMNAFDMLVWTGAYYLVVRIARTGNKNTWLWLGLLLGLGLFNKIGLFVFGFALVIGLLVTRHRRHFLDRRLWLAGVIAGALLLPYIIWNATHDWATMEFMENARRYKISDLSALDFLSESILEANPLTLPLWLGGLAWLVFARRARHYQIVAVMIVVTFVTLVLQKGKPYYFVASFPVLMAAGGAAWEQWTSGRRVRWARWAMAAVLVCGGVVLAPIGVLFLSPERTVAYAQRLGITPKAQEVGHTAPLPQYFADRFGWEELAQTVSRVYESLPLEEKRACVVIADNYGKGGALEYWSRRYALPPVYCRHNHYWLWGPPPDVGGATIVVGFGREDIEESFAEVIEAAVSETPYAQEPHISVWVCRGLRLPMAEVWAQSKLFI